MCNDFSSSLECAAASQGSNLQCLAPTREKWRGTKKKWSFKCPFSHFSKVCVLGGWLTTMRECTTMAIVFVSISVISRNNPWSEHRSLTWENRALLSIMASRSCKQAAPGVCAPLPAMELELGGGYCAKSWHSLKWNTLHSWNRPPGSGKPAI